MEPVRDARVSPKMTVEDLIRLYGDIHGFMAGHLHTAVEVLREALKRSSLRVLTFTGNLVSTGLRGIIAQLIQEGLFNLVITTTGALDHDIARASGGVYYKGYFEADDSILAEKDIHRLGNVFIPVESYGPKVEGFVKKLVDTALREKKEWPLYELLWLAGSMIDDENSILRSAYNRGVPVFVPGWPDGAFGTSLFMVSQQSGLRIDYMLDMRKLAEIFFTSKGEAAALIIGGGISKHHAIWWSQFRDGLDYVVYLTTAVEYDGSLSGAHPREAVSWGKVKPKARKVVVYGDATITLPILAAGLLADR